MRCRSQFKYLHRRPCHCRCWFRRDILWCHCYYRSNSPSAEATYLCWSYGVHIRHLISRWAINGWCFHGPSVLAMVLLHQVSKVLLSTYPTLFHALLWMVVSHSTGTNRSVLLPQSSNRCFHAGCPLHFPLGST